MENIDKLASEPFDNLKYILNSTVRIKLLIILYEGNRTLQEIKNIMDKRDSNLLRSLKDLEEIGLIEKDNKKFKLTSSGFLLTSNIKNLVENWYCTNEYEDFWKTHLLKNVPFKFLRNTHIWHESKIIKSTEIDYIKPLQTYLEKIKQSKKIKIILPIYSEEHIEAIFNATNENNGSLDLITTRAIIDKINDSSYKDLFNKLKENKQLIIWTKPEDELYIFFTVTDTFYSLSLFYIDGSYDDSVMLINENKNNNYELNQLFDSYIEK